MEGVTWSATLVRAHRGLRPVQRDGAHHASATRVAERSSLLEDCVVVGSRGRLPLDDRPGRTARVRQTGDPSCPTISLRALGQVDNEIRVLPLAFNLL